MKRILIYNWIPFDEKGNKGGGVTVYTNNLIRNLCGDDEVELFFLSSGRAYTGINRSVYIESVSNVYGDRCRCYQVVNSPVLSSARLMFPFLQDYLTDRKLKKIFRNFLEEIGGVDIIHFQNFEGLSLSVLELKEEFPQTKFIYSLHNYFPFCPAVSLWKEDKENCSEKSCGNECIKCMQSDIYKFKVKYNQSVEYKLQGISNNYSLKGQLFLKGIFENICKVHCRFFRKKYSKRKIKKYGKIFIEFHYKNINYINRYIDCVLAVSERVAEIARKKGIKESKIKVCYIGTDVANIQVGKTLYPYDGKNFRICYLGYMRKMKGFYFLLDALEEMDQETAQKVSIVFASKITDMDAKYRIEKLKQKFAEVKLINGYKRETLGEILNGVQLGIVPVLWEDNLPQVAIEMKAHGIPVLSSDLGGAKELTKAENFVFEAGNKRALLLRLQDFVNQKISLDEYWDNGSRIISMEEHIEELKHMI